MQTPACVVLVVLVLAATTHAALFTAETLHTKNAALSLLCICRQFSSPDLLLTDRLDPDAPCSLGSYAPLNISSLNVPHVIQHPNGELQLDGYLTGMLMRVFTAQEENDSGDLTVIVAIRHQETENPLRGEMQEAMGLWGRNVATKPLKAWAAPGTPISFIARMLQLAFHKPRRALGLDYLTQAVQIWDSVKAALRNQHQPARQLHVAFTGYSMGGSIAQMLALREDPHNPIAVTFAAPGVLDVITQLYADSLPQIRSLENAYPLLRNYVLVQDDVPQIDCQIAEMCAFMNKQTQCTRGQGEVATVAQAECVAHEEFVYGQWGVAALRDDWANVNCVRAVDWNRNYGTCIGIAVTMTPAGQEEL